MVSGQIFHRQQHGEVRLIRPCRTDERDRRARRVGRSPLVLSASSGEGEQAGDHCGHSQSAPHYADIAARRESTGRPISFADGQIAVICRSHDAVLATRNVDDFIGTGVRLINPWTG